MIIHSSFTGNSPDKKGEGEVKLNMAIGKGEQALRSSNKKSEDDQTQLQTLKDVCKANIMGSSVHAQRYRAYF